MLSLAVSDLGVEVAHLRVLLDIESIVHISADAEPKVVNRYHFVPGWSLKHMELDHVILAGGNDPELTESHLKHHVLL